MINRIGILHRLGRRGIMLTLMGGVYVLLGLGSLLRHPTPISTRYNFLYFPPDWVEAALWFVTGGIACGFAWRRDDSWGWAVLYVMPSLRVIAYLIAWIAGLIHGNGNPTAWYSGVLYLPFVAVTLICSGWRENTGPPEPVPNEEGH